ncbi:MAG: nicotinate (nicotinamide) nucleotide adenylyltransferase [Desulfovibrionaceae bacterium]|nr:nicotinate (nicotinamide) nucleotide adenylyltransferase [Desulfovibrionaceae bacterium]MBF0514905.1 nicotinate (nicotinamide) nucleotide adenylyltransferase [Desulfovibrionaceae bacterium]
MTTRVGIFGGSFNPPHVGHLRAAVEVREALRLALVEMVPVAVAPHKPEADMLPAAFRLRLLELSLAGVPGLRACDLEMRRPGPSYTIDTLRRYAGQNPDRDLYFILGVNDLLNLPHWKEGPELGRVVNLAVVPRDGLGLAEASDFLARRAGEFGLTRSGETAWRFRDGFELVYVDIPRIDVNASLLRDKWRSGASLAGLIPGPALEALLASGELLASRWGGFTFDSKR